MQFMPGAAACSFDIVHDNVANSNDVLKYLLLRIFLSFKIIRQYMRHPCCYNIQ